ncbi:hypothetical protein F5Y19DRAFT_480619 [Xylariaceae sp. FL1651]|nr:hypothetical protein F5Y19DRAFT_480619 [Xylariaceae sp. FL1651]
MASSGPNSGNDPASIPSCHPRRSNPQDSCQTSTSGASSTPNTSASVGSPQSRASAVDRQHGELQPTTPYSSWQPQQWTDSDLTGAQKTPSRQMDRNATEPPVVHSHSNRVDEDASFPLLPNLDNDQYNTDPSELCYEAQWLSPAISYGMLGQQTADERANAYWEQDAQESPNTLSQHRQDNRAHSSGSVFSPTALKGITCYSLAHLQREHRSCLTQNQGPFISLGGEVQILAPSITAKSHTIKNSAMIRLEIRHSREMQRAQGLAALEQPLTDF